MTRRSLVQAGLVLLALAGLTSLYAGAIRTGFLNDDHLFLEEARRPLPQSLTSLGPLGNFYRPVSRQLYFEALAPLAGPRALPYHLASYAVFLLSLALLVHLLRAVLPLPGVLAGTLYFALLPFQRVNLMWVSCIQDLLALAFTLSSLALHRMRRTGLSALAYLLAIFSKESALPLPLLLLAWDRWIEPDHEAPWWKRTRLHLGALALWGAITWAIRAGRPAQVPLGFGPGHFLAGAVHGLQGLLGLDHPPGLLEGLARHGPPPAALLLLAAPALLLLRSGTGTAPKPPGAPIRFGLAWLAVFLLPLGPVASIWSSYYATLTGVGAAALVGLALSRIGPTGWLVLVGALLWWHAGATSVRAFSVAQSPWVWTSHLTAYYFQRGAALSDTLGRQLLALEPRPEPRTRFFFATLPPWAGFQMGNGPAIRTLYRDPTLESWFYSQFSESTAANHPCRFISWDGRSLHPLYGPETDVFFQVGTDLLMFDRPAAARHAFRRGLLRGENRADHLYWLGWTELWLGQRRAAETAWSTMGARDDSAAWHWLMRRARVALMERRDTVDARRLLGAAIQLRIGHPDAHAILGSLLLPSHPKYGMLELKVALGLRPSDWVARRELLLAMASMRMDEAARRELAAIARQLPEWRRDSTLVRTARELDRRRASPRVIEF